MNFNNFNMKELLELYELDQIDKVLNHALKSGMNIEQIEGTLRDEYVIQTNGMRLLKGFKKYKFLVLKSVFLNAWNSTTVICGTDSAKKVVKFLESREIEDTLNLEL